MACASSVEVDCATPGAGAAKMRLSADTAAESGDKRFFMMVPLNAGRQSQGVARRTHDRKCTAIMRGGNPSWTEVQLAQVSVMSALPPKADIGRLRMASTFIWKTQPPS